jgi:hypothetical protein
VSIPAGGRGSASSVLEPGGGSQDRVVST